MALVDPLVDLSEPLAASVVVDALADFVDPLSFIDALAPELLVPLPDAPSGLAAGYTSSSSM